MYNWYERGVDGQDDKGRAEVAQALIRHVDERTVWHLCGTPKQNVCANSRTVRAQVCMMREGGWRQYMVGATYEGNYE